MMLCGFVAFAAPLEAPWWHLVAIGFGVGAGFTLDEFALWVRLEDVYWRDEGRASFDAVVCSCAFAALVVLGARPFGLDDPELGLGDGARHRGRARARDRVLREGARRARRDRPVRPVRRRRGRRCGSRTPPPPGRSRWYREDKRARAERRFAPTRPLSRAHRRMGDLVAGAPTRSRRDRRRRRIGREVSPPDVTGPSLPRACGRWWAATPSSAGIARARGDRGCRGVVRQRRRRASASRAWRARRRPQAERDGALVDWVQATSSAAAVPLGAFAGLIPDDAASDDRAGADVAQH